MKSRTKRMVEKVAPVPAPGKYEINRSLLRKKPYKVKGPMSSFAKTVRRKEVNIQEKSKIKKKIENGDTIREYKGGEKEYVPGPGDYNLPEVNFDEKMVRWSPMMKMNKFKYENLHKTSAFKSGLDRFKIDKEKLMKPGPWRYDKKDEFKVKKTKVRGAAFMSESDRNAFKIKKLTNRFGVFHATMKPEKESFRFNVNKNFVV